MSSGPHWWKPQRKRPIGKFLMNFFVLTCLERHLSAYYMTSVVSRASKWWVQVFWAPSLCSYAPLKHCTEAIELSEELSKVLGQLPCTFSFRRTWSRLRRLRSEFQGALWPLSYSRHSPLGLEAYYWCFDVTLQLFMLWGTVWCWFCWNWFLH